MTGYRRGNVVLVGFIFSDRSGTKFRPALVVSSAAYHRRREELIISAIASNTNRLLLGNHLIAGWKDAGLLFRHDYLADATLADAICDRVFHNAHRIVLKGPSRRKEATLDD